MTSTKKGQYDIKLSVNPADVNTSLSATHLKNGLVLSSCVSSREDHGYVLDLGIKGVKAFLKNKAADKYIADHRDGEPLKIGCYMSVMVNLDDNLQTLMGESRVFNVLVAPNKVYTSTLTTSMNITMHNLLPGMAVEATITKVETDGLRMKFLSYSGFVHRTHLAQNPTEYEKGTQLQAVVLYIVPSTKVVSLTLLPHLVTPHICPRSLFGAVQNTQIVHDAKVMYVNKTRGVYFKIMENIVALAYLKELTDDGQGEVLKDFAVGSVHRCRVINFDYADRVVLVSCKRSTLEKQFLKFADIQPGQIVQCSVKTVIKKGVIVRVSPAIEGFIPNMHLSDIPLQNREKKFLPGNSLHCRAVIVDPAHKKLVLTNKKSLVTSKLPIVTTYEQLAVGTIVEGIIVKVMDKGIVVVFYNNIKGYVPKTELSAADVAFPHEVFFVGQLVKAQVLSVVPERQRLLLSLKMSGEVTHSVKNTDVPSDLSIGKSVNCKVDNVTKDGVRVTILPSNTSAFLPIMHMSDSMELCSIIAKRLKPDTLLNDLVLIGHGSVITVSNKQSVKMAGESLQRETSSLTVDTVLPAVVKKIVPKGVVLDLYNGLEGFTPNKFLFKKSLSDPGRLFTIGQSLMAKVVELRPNNTIVSVRLSQFVDTYVESGVDMLNQYLSVCQDAMAKGAGKIKSLREYTMGQSVHLTSIKDVGPEGYRCKLLDGTVAIAPRQHLTGAVPVASEKTAAVILHVDPINKCTYVSTTLQPAKVESQAKVTVGQKSQCTVQLILAGCVVVSLKASGQLAYIPVRKHLNDFLGIWDYRIGQTYDIIVKSVDGQLIVAEMTDQQRHTEPRIDASVLESVLSKGANCRNEPLAVVENDIFQAVITGVKSMELCVAVEGIPGRVYITELVDSLTTKGQLLMNDYKKQTSIKVKVLKIVSQPSDSDDGNTQFLECSARLSALEAEHRERSFTVGKKYPVFISEVKPHELVIKYSVNGTCSLPLFKGTDTRTNTALKRLKVGAGYPGHVLKNTSAGIVFSIVEKSVIWRARVVQCRVTAISASDGLSLQLPLGHVAKVALTDLADEYKSHPTSEFSIGQMLLGRIVHFNINGNSIVSLRQSRVKANSDRVIKDPEIMNISALSKGDLLRGYVVKISEAGITVTLSSSIQGIVGYQHTRLGTNTSDTAYSIGQSVTACVLTVEKNKVQLSLLKKHTQLEEMPNNQPSVQKSNDKTNKRSHDEQTPLKSNKQTKATKRKEDNAVFDFPSKKRKTEDNDSGVEEDEDEQDEISTEAMKTTPHLNLNAAFSWNSSYETPMDTSQTTQHSDSDGSDEVEEEKKVVVRKSRHEKQAEKAMEEKRLFAIEQASLTGDQQPQTTDQFDRLVLQSPNSSMVWLRYMAFHLETTEIEKARAVAERALKTISFREEQEKLNVWVALLNLENLYGSAELLKTVLDRALQHNDQLSIYQQLVKIYVQSQKLEEAEQLYATMVKRFCHEASIWVTFGTFYFRNNKADMAQKLLQRALNTLEKKHHVEIISKFGQLEFRFGEPERGKTMFENMLSSYPRRTDLWSVYLDMLTKHGDLDSARQQYDRAVHLNLAPRKMKFFFKKYLDFEQKFGTEDSVAKVKQKAIDYVESNVAST